MEDREKDIQTLAKAVLDNCIKWGYQSNSYDRFYCVFCNKDVPDHSKTGDDIVHDLDCPYLIAKDLTTNLIRCCTNKQKTANNFIWNYLNN